jgi:hypothetical protein
MVATSQELPQEAVYSPSPFHAGEQKIQTLTGAREVSEKLGEHKKRPPILYRY